MSTVKEQVIVTQITISKAGQSKYFQIRIPKNAKRIIGIEVGYRLVSITKRVGTDPAKAAKTRVEP